MSRVHAVNGEDQHIIHLVSFQNRLGGAMHRMHKDDIESSSSVNLVSVNSTVKWMKASWPVHAIDTIYEKYDAVQIKTMYNSVQGNALAAAEWGSGAVRRSRDAAEALSSYSWKSWRLF